MKKALWFSGPPEQGSFKYKVAEEEGDSDDDIDFAAADAAEAAHRRKSEAAELADGMDFSEEEVALEQATGAAVRQALKASKPPRQGEATPWVMRAENVSSEQVKKLASNPDLNNNTIAIVEDRSDCIGRGDAALVSLGPSTISVKRPASGVAASGFSAKRKPTSLQ